MQNFIKMLESIGPDDMVCIFKCGELAKNPDALISGSTNTIQGYICPACGKRERRITTWTQCNHPGCERIIQRTDRRPVKFCPDCATERAKDHRRKRSRLNKSGITTMADHDYEMTLDEIGKEIGVTRERARQIMVTAMRKVERNWKKIVGTDSPFDFLPEEQSGDFVYRGLK